jgi:uncharacterized protein YcgL (UPF0745 family)
MINHFEMQQIMEAKKMEIDRKLHEQSYYLQTDKNNTKSSLFELFKKMFGNRKIAVKPNIV